MLSLSFELFINNLSALGASPRILPFASTGAFIFNTLVIKNSVPRFKELPVSKKSSLPSNNNPPSAFNEPALTILG